MTNSSVTKKVHCINSCKRFLFHSLTILLFIPHVVRAMVICQALVSQLPLLRPTRIHLLIPLLTPPHPTSVLTKNLIQSPRSWLVNGLLEKPLFPILFQPKYPLMAPPRSIANKGGSRRTFMFSTSKPLPEPASFFSFPRQCWFRSPGWLQTTLWGLGENIIVRKVVTKALEYTCWDTVYSRWCQSLSAWFRRLCSGSSVLSEVHNTCTMQ